MKKFEDINIIPFIDIMLVLLSIVLITASFISQGKIKVSVPKAANAVAMTSEDLVSLITLDKSGKLYLNEVEVGQDELESEIDKWPKDRKVTLKIDGEATFQNFVSITDLLKKRGITEVSIASRKSKNPDGERIRRDDKS